jgi:hypothetical protein
MDHEQDGNARRTTTARQRGVGPVGGTLGCTLPMAGVPATLAAPATSSITAPSRITAAAAAATASTSAPAAPANTCPAVSVLNISGREQAWHGSISVNMDRFQDGNGRLTVTTSSMRVWKVVGLGTLSDVTLNEAPAALIEDLSAATETCPKRLLIEARWGSKPLAFAGKLQPRRPIE